MNENRLIVANKDWYESVPDWMKDQVEMERVAQGLSNASKPSNEIDRMVGDAEACVYLYTLGMVGPMDRDLTTAYLYLGAKLMKQRVGEKNLPEEALEYLERGLNEYEQHCLDSLKRDLYKKRGGEISSPLFDALKGLKEAK